MINPMLVAVEEKYKDQIAKDDLRTLVHKDDLKVFRSHLGVAELLEKMEELEQKRVFLNDVRNAMSGYFCSCGKVIGPYGAFTPDTLPKKCKHCCAEEKYQKEQERKKGLWQQLFDDLAKDSPDQWSVDVDRNIITRQRGTSKVYFHEQTTYSRRRFPSTATQSFRLTTEDYDISTRCIKTFGDKNLVLKLLEKSNELLLQLENKKNHMSEKVNAEQQLVNCILKVFPDAKDICTPTSVNYHGRRREVIQGCGKKFCLERNGFMFRFLTDDGVKFSFSTHLGFPMEQENFQGYLDTVSTINQEVTNAIHSKSETNP